MREIKTVLEQVERNELPKSAASLRRRIDSAMFEVLLRGGGDRLRDLVASLGKLLRTLATSRAIALPSFRAEGKGWLQACSADCAEVRIAAALASLYDREAGSIRGNLTQKFNEFAWQGVDLPGRMLAVLDRRSRAYSYSEGSRPFAGTVRLPAGDATLFMERSVDDELIEDLLFAFCCFDWSGGEKLQQRAAEPSPAYAALKFLYLPDAVVVNGAARRLSADPRITAILRAGDVQRAVQIAVEKLRIAGLRPIHGAYYGGMDARRLGAALLIPTYGFRHAILQDEEREAVS